MDCSVNIDCSYYYYAKKLFYHSTDEYRAGDNAIPVNLMKQLFDLVPVGVRVKRKM